MSLPDLVSGREAAKILGVSNKTVSRWAECGKLPKPQRVGPTLAFKRTDIEAAKKRMKKAAKLRERADKIESASASESREDIDTA